MKRFLIHVSTYWCGEEAVKLYHDIMKVIVNG